MLGAESQNIFDFHDKVEQGSYSDADSGDGSTEEKCCFVLPQSSAQITREEGAGFRKDRVLTQALEGSDDSRNSKCMSGGGGGKAQTETWIGTETDLEAIVGGKDGATILPATQKAEPGPRQNAKPLSEGLKIPVGSIIKRKKKKV